MINSYKITEYLSNNELFDLLDLAKNVGNYEFIVKQKDRLGDFALFIADQNSLDDKASVKLPSFHKKRCIYSARSLEQCTAEAVAVYKASKIKGDRLLTLASGLGADDFALSSSFREVISADNDEVLNTIAIHNFNLLDKKNIRRITSTAEDFIKNNTLFFDAVYIDPDRRDGNERQILLAQHKPDVIKLLPSLLNISDNVWIKCSPLYDADMALKEIATISEIYCISLKGEVKEMLLKVGKHIAKDKKVICADISSKGIIEAEFNNNWSIPGPANEISGYFFEAGSVLVKMRENHSYAVSHHLFSIDIKVPFYTGEKAIEGFIGKCLKIKDSFAFNPKQIKLYLKNLNIGKINIKARGVKTDIPSLFKKLEIKEGGDEFLFICPFGGKTIVIHCEPLGSDNR